MTGQACSAKFATGVTNGRTTATTGKTIVTTGKTTAATGATTGKTTAATGVTIGKTGVVAGPGCSGNRELDDQRRSRCSDKRAVAPARLPGATRSAGREWQW
jgi:hypothetical protein